MGQIVTWHSASRVRPILRRTAGPFGRLFSLLALFAAWMCGRGLNSGRPPLRRNRPLLAGLLLLAIGIAPAMAQTFSPPDPPNRRVCDVDITLLQGGSFTRDANVDMQSGSCTGTFQRTNADTTPATPLYIQGSAVRNSSDFGRRDLRVTNGTISAVSPFPGTDPALFVSTDNSFSFTYQADSVVPGGAVDSFAVTVRPSNDQDRGYVFYRVTFVGPPPTVTALAPTSGPAAGGNSVVITGTDFTGATAVAFGAAPASSFTVNSATQITAVAPPGSGTVNIRVTTPGGTSATGAANAYTYVPAPTVTSATPNSGPAAGGTAVTIGGTNFFGAAAVTFGGTAASSFTVNSATQITATTPARGAGAVDVAVTSAGGTGTLANGFTYVTLTAPTVLTQPQNQTVGVGATATFTASASGSPAPTVRWQASAGGGGFADIPGATAASYTTPATVASDNDRQYRAVFTNSQGTATTSAATLTVIQAPNANAQSVTVPFNTATSFTLTGTDPNTPARTLTYAVATQPTRGTLTGTAPNLTYTPTAAGRGADSFTFTVSNGVSSSAPATVSITIADPSLTITNSPPPAQRGLAYSFQFTTSGGTGSYAYSITSGALPAGLTLTSSGQITGTPTASGSFPATVTVEDAGLGSPPVTQSQAFTIAVAAPTLTASPPPGALPGGTVGVAYSQTFTTSGGTAPYTYALTGGSLPAGMTLASGGQLSGTPTQAGSFSFDVTATDSSSAADGGPYTLTAAYSITIQAATVVVTPPAIPQPQVGIAYTANLGATGGTAPYTFAVTAGALPTGLSLDSAGVLSGTPTAGGSFGFTVTATDGSTGPGAPFSGSQAYTVTVLAPAITLAPGVLPPATGGQPYSQALTASGGTAPYTFAVTAGVLPAGVTLASDGTLSGTPTAQGSFTFTVTALDSSTGGPNAGGAYAGSTAYTLAVGAPAIAIAPTLLPDGAIAAAYSQTLTASGGTGPYTYSVVTGALPAGLTLTAGGILSGTPTAAGSFAITVRAEDDNGFTGTRAYDLVIAAPTLSLVPTSLPSATRNVAYSQTFTATGGTAPFTFAVTAGALPAGITLASSGTLSGLPTAAGSFTFTLTVTDASTGTGPFTASASYTLAVSVPTIAINPATLPAGTTRVAYSQALTASGGTDPYTFAVTAGALPSGFTLAAGGILSGTTTQSGNFTFTATATDANGNAGDQVYTLAITAPAIAIAPTTLPAGTAGVAYTQTLQASGGIAPYTYAVPSGALPAGITLAANGTLAGTTGQSGSFAFTATATDASGNTGQQAYTLTINAPAIAIAIAPASLPNGTGSTAYLQTFTATGGIAPYTFLATGSLPDGLSLAADGTLSGMPTRSGSFAFTVSATDANGFVGSAGYTVQIDAPAIVLAPGELPPAILAAPYSQPITASGGAAPYGFILAGGALPDGLSLGADGLLSGTPTTSGAFAIVVRATDANGFTGTANYSLRVEGERPTAANSSVTVAAGASVTVDLTQGATGGPFTRATIVAQPDPRLGSATLDNGGVGTSLVFAASPTASGIATVSYTLSNAFGPSNVATLTVQIEARPDPSLDPEVVGILGAQADSTRRVARAQIRNFRDRLERTHKEDERRQGSANISVGLPSEPIGNDPMALFEERRDGGLSDRFGSFGDAPGRERSTPLRETGTGVGEPPSRNAAFWAGGFVNFGSRDIDEVSIDLDRTLVGLSGGVDYRFTPQFVGGIGIGYGRERTDVGQNGTQSHAEAYNGALYGSYALVENLFLDGLVGYSRLEFDSERFITGTSDIARGERSGDQVFGSLTATYERRGDGYLFAPYFGVEGSQAQLDAFTEAGAGSHLLTFGEQDVSSLAGILGLRLETDVEFDWGVLTPRGRVEFSRDFAQSDRASLGYADIGTLAYGLRTDLDSRDRLEFGVGFDAAFGDIWSFAFDYQPALGLEGGQRDHSVAVQLTRPF